MKSDVKTTYAQNLEKIFSERPLLTKTDFAKKLGVTNTSVQRWLNGESLPSAETLQEIANYFNVSVFYFFMNESEQVKWNNPPKSYFEIFIEGMARKTLKGADLEAYCYYGGASGYLKILVDNFESDSVIITDWTQKLTAALAEVINLDVNKKMKENLAKKYGDEVIKKISKKTKSKPGPS